MSESTPNTMPEFAPVDGAMIKPLCSVESEQMILGAVMMWSDCWERVVGTVSESDFFRKDHRIVFSALTALARGDGATDVVAVHEHLERAGQADTVGGLSYLANIANNTPGSSNVRHYAKVVRDYAIRRQLVADAHDLIEAVHGSEELPVIVNDAQHRITSITTSEKTTQPKKASEYMTGVNEEIQKRFDCEDSVVGLSTGWVDLDKKLAGLHPGHLVIVAGRPSMGKTTFAMNMIEHAAVTLREKSLVFSMEMPANELLDRCISSTGNILHDHIRTGRLDDADWASLARVNAELSDAPLIIDETPNLSVHELCARARRVARDGALSLIMIDYLQLMRIKGQNVTFEIGEITRQLKSLAKELSVPVVLLSQLNRSLENRPNKRPMMSDLRDSGSIEQDADVIIFPYRDEVYDAYTPDKGVAEILIAKQRGGEISAVKLAFQGQFVRFVNYAPEILPLPLERPEAHRPYAKKNGLD